MPSRNKGFFRGVLYGAALGAGLLAYQNHKNRTNPLGTSAQRHISAALERTLQQARQQDRFLLNPDSKYILFSDHHKGARDGADDFQPCEATYLAALDYYQKNGYTLILLGDVEELWENEIPQVMQAYANVFQAEQAFYPERYMRVVGNHDEAWNDPELVAQYLEPYYPGIRVKTGIVLEFKVPVKPRRKSNEAVPKEAAPRLLSGTTGEIFLAHGHQGTFDSEVLGGFSPKVLPLYRKLQNLTGIGHTTPAENEYLRSQHDTQMYRWSAQKDDLALIAGHTHRPVWTSLTYLDQLYMQLFALEQYKDKLTQGEFTRQRQRLEEEIRGRERTETPGNDTLKTRPSYFNTGCCRFADGDITGIEITGKDIRLIKWSRPTLQRQELAQMALSELFDRL